MNFYSLIVIFLVAAIVWVGLSSFGLISNELPKISPWNEKEIESNKIISMILYN